MHIFVRMKILRQRVKNHADNAPFIPAASRATYSCYLLCETPRRTIEFQESNLAFKEKLNNRLSNEERQRKKQIKIDVLL